MTGLGRGVNESIRGTLEPKYYGQMYEDIFKYKCILSLCYIKHVEIKWVFLDEMQNKAMANDYKRGSGSDE